MRFKTVPTCSSTMSSFPRKREPSVLLLNDKGAGLTRAIHGARPWAACGVRLRYPANAVGSPPGLIKTLRSPLMNTRHKWFAAFAIGATLASGSAAAAVNANTMHVALSSLKLALVKIGVVNVYLTPAVGVSDGIVQLVPKIVTGKDGKQGVQYTCHSPNIPDIAGAEPECTYHSAQK